MSGRRLLKTISSIHESIKSLQTNFPVCQRHRFHSTHKLKAKHQPGGYRLTDNFFRFWYTFGFANLSQLEDGDTEGVYDYLVAPALHEFASLAFEDVCKEFVRKLQKNALPFRYTK